MNWALFNLDATAWTAIAGWATAIATIVAVLWQVRKQWLLNSADMINDLEKRAMDLRKLELNELDLPRSLKTNGIVLLRSLRTFFLPTLPKN